MRLPAHMQRAVALSAVLAAGAGLLGFSAGSVKSMDRELKAMAPTQQVLDGKLVVGRSRDRCMRRHTDVDVPEHDL